MRIIGGHDYYDSGLAYGQDESVVFVRNKEVILNPRDLKLAPLGCLPVIQKEEEKNSWVRENYFTFYRGRVPFSAYIVTAHVVFCGWYYSGVKVDWGYGRESQIFWDRESLSKFLRKFKLKVWTEEQEKKLRRQTSSPFLRYKLSGEALERVIENRITVATFSIRNNDYSDFMVNSDTLKDYQFFKIRDAYSAFQEISMWVGGVLPREGNPMVEITDQKVKAHKAGFDPKTAFRHPFKIPSGRKGRRKETQDS